MIPKRLCLGMLISLVIWMGSGLSPLAGEDTQIRIVVERATIRSQPDVSGDVLSGDIAVGTVFTVVAKKGDWFEIRYRSRMGARIPGYIHSMYVELVKPKAAVKPPAEPRVPPPVSPPPSRVGARRAFLEFALLGGVGLVNPDDYNAMVRGFGDYWSEADDYFDWGELKMMGEAGAELIFNLMPNIGFGIGAGYLFKSSS